MTSHPFPGVEQQVLRRWVVVATIVALMTGAAMLVLDQSLSERGAGIIELELADTDRSWEILDGWGPAGCDAEGFGCTTGDIVWRAKASVLIDFAFLAAYGLGAAALLAALANGRRSGPAWAHGALERLAWAPLLAAICDALENAMLWQVLVLHPEGFAEVATASAVVKFSLVGITVIAAPAILVAGRRVQSVPERETHPS